MDWWLIIGAVIAAALAYAYWDHGRQSRRLTAIFNRLAAQRGGVVKRATFLALPQLRFEADGRRFLVGAMASAGAIPRDRAPFTFVNVELPFDTGVDLRLVPMTDIAERLIDAANPLTPPATGDEDFDRAFRIKGKDPAAEIFDPPLRQRLLGTNLRLLDLYVEGRKVRVHVDGFAETQPEVEDLIGLAGLVADGCPKAM